jgi:DNA-directed RNA polymerase specialized sigma24 family protein
MKDDSPLTPKWIADNTDLIHYLLKQWNIVEFETPDYEDRVQDIVLDALLTLDRYNPEKASKSTFIALLVSNNVLGKVAAKEKLFRNFISYDRKHDVGEEEDMSTQIHAQREYDKLTEIQQMQALGYTCKEISVVSGLSADYIRNTKGLATRGKV